MNPILLATALGLSIVKARDWKGFLRQYTSGLDVAGLDEELLAFPQTLNETDSFRVLAYEAQYVKAFMDMSKQLLQREGPLALEPFTFRKGPPTVWDVYASAWILANPAFDGGEVRRIGWQYARSYGFAVNSSILRNQRACDERLITANAAVVGCLSAPPSPERKASLSAALRQQTLATKLVHRARQLYHWAPHEIEAHAIGTDYVLQHMHNNADDPEVEHHSKYLLPAELTRDIQSFGGKHNGNKPDSAG